MAARWDRNNLLTKNSQIVGDRYSFLPYWLVHACVSRGWIFVTSDYRLLPETNAQSSVADGLDAYDWVSSRLAEEIDRKFDSIILAGSSAGGYLALTVAAALSHKPNALLLIYGMLDPGYERYTKPGSNISGRPAIATEPVLAQYPKPGDEHGRPHLSNYPISSDVTKDERFQLISALHLDALFPDYLTGIRGLSLSINSQGLETIPERHRNLFPSHSPTLRIFRAQS